MKFLSRDEILKAQDIEPETVAVPEWGGDVRMRCGTGEERDAFDLSIVTGKGKDRDVNTKLLREKLLALAIVDEEGKRLFSEADLAALSKKNSKVIHRLFGIAQRIWGLKQEDVDSLSGESKPGRSSAPGIDSPGNGASPHLVTSSAS